MLFRKIRDANQAYFVPFYLQDYKYTNESEVNDGISETVVDTDHNCVRNVRSSIWGTTNVWNEYPDFTDGSAKSIVTGTNYNRRNSRTYSFFIHPKLTLLKFSKRSISVLSFLDGTEPSRGQLELIQYFRFPYLMRLPFEGERGGIPRIEATVRIFNTGKVFFSFFAKRADDCRAVIYFKKENENLIVQTDCVWNKNNTLSATIPTGLLPQILRIFAIDPVSHEILSAEREEPEKRIPSILTSGTYEMTLVLDYQDGKSTNVNLGKLNLPSDVLSNKESFNIWRSRVGKEGYAIFPERTNEGKNIATVIGKIPEKRLKELQTEHPVLKNFTFVLD